MDRQRREAFFFEVFDLRSASAERVDQIADGPFAHPGHAVEHVISTRECKHGGQRPERRARVTQEQLRATHGETSAAAFHAQASFVLRPHVDAKLRQRLPHPRRVVGFQ